MMCVLSAAAGWWGYRSEYWQRFSKPIPDIHYSPSGVFKGGVVLYLISFYAAYQLAELAGGFIEQFTGGGHYSLEWVGLPVRYTFVIHIMYPALFLCLLGALYRPNFAKTVTVLLFSLYPICVILFLGRRATAVFVGLIFLLALFFSRRWAPPRSAFAAAIFGAMTFAFIGPQYRTISQYGLDMERLREIEVPAAIEDVLSGSTYLEFDALVVNAAAINRTKTFGFGTGFYNSTIAQLVPRQFVGGELKSSLMIYPWGNVPTSFTLYQWEIPYGSNPTGPLNAFGEFWFLGAFLYYGIGLICRYLWEQAFAKGSVPAQVWYLVWAVSVPSSIVGSLAILPGQLLAYYLFLAPLLWVIKRRSGHLKEVPPPAAFHSASLRRG